MEVVIQGPSASECYAYANLRPITPAHSTRYAKPGRATVCSKCILPGLFSRRGEPEPKYLASGWINCIQAEGQPYFYHSEGHFVTEANIYNPEKLERITHWMGVVRKFAEMCDIEVTNSMEIMLQLDDDDESLCSYYLIEHDSGSVFWLHEITSEDVGIPESASYAQLRWASTENYWTHVEYFSAHLSGVRMSCARELISILTHARADHLTSLVGTFPYSAAQCKDFADLLRDHVSGSSEVLTDTYIICIVARLWGQVARHRFMNHYGEENARLSRDQRVLDDSARGSPLMFKLLSKTVFFGIPCTFITELDGLWVDNIVYAESWKQFMPRCLADWKESAVWGVALTLFHAFFFFSSIGSHSIAIASLALSIVGFIASLALVNYHRMPLNFETSDAAGFLSQTHHPIFGFAPLSLVYSIPKALVFWTAALLILQAGLAAYQVTDRYVASGLAGLALVAVCTVTVALRRSATAAIDAETEAEEVPAWKRVLNPFAPYVSDSEKDYGTFGNV
ncbi:hypothetical protein M0805_002089 [Coniferiporia weirii]|nr:hypothetical protein M0805_002089 [Coniferiporia weirii]